MFQRDEKIKEIIQAEENFMSDQNLICAYNKREKYFRDMISLEDSIRNKGREEGFREGKEEAKKDGVDESPIKGTILLLKKLHTPHDESIRQLMELYDMDVEQAKESLERYL